MSQSSENARHIEKARKAVGYAEGLAWQARQAVMAAERRLAAAEEEAVVAGQALKWVQKGSDMQEDSVFQLTQRLAQAEASA